MLNRFKVKNIQPNEDRGFGFNPLGKKSKHLDSPLSPVEKNELKQAERNDEVKPNDDNSPKKSPIFREDSDRFELMKLPKQERQSWKHFLMKTIEVDFF
jgi:hypothetical protein